MPHSIAAQAENVKSNLTEHYTFDKVGNRLTKTEGANTTTYTYNSVNELTSSSEGSYT
jgi:uncharacterized protein RhaS with RHS repeats